MFTRQIDGWIGEVSVGYEMSRQDLEGNTYLPTYRYIQSRSSNYIVIQQVFSVCTHKQHWHRHHHVHFHRTSFIHT